jgi:hypothetical protein
MAGFTQPFFHHAVRRTEAEIVHMIGNIAVSFSSTGSGSMSMGSSTGWSPNSPRFHARLSLAALFTHEVKTLNAFMKSSVITPTGQESSPENRPFRGLACRTPGVLFEC